MRHNNLEDENSNTPPKPSNRKSNKRKIPKKITPSYLHNSGLHYLQRFAASKYQFQEVMLRKVKRSCFYHKDQELSFCLDLVYQLVDRFEKSGLLNDQLYARGMVHSLLRRGVSHRMMISKLAQKGINEKEIISILADVYEEIQENPQTSEIKAALRFKKRRKLPSFFKNSNYAEKNKAHAIMARAGFSQDVIQKVLTMPEEELEDYL